MKTTILAILLASGLATAGCAALTPGEAQRYVAVLNQDLGPLRDAVARVTTNAKLLRDLAAIHSNIDTLDTILNK